MSYTESIKYFNPEHQLFLFIIIFLTVWSLYWKWKALWLAAHQEQKKWFIALLIVNTVGILEILYLYVFSKKLEHTKREDL